MTDPRYIGTILYVGLAIFAALLAAGLLMQERRRSVQKAARYGARRDLSCCWISICASACCRRRCGCRCR